VPVVGYDVTLTVLFSFIQWVSGCPLENLGFGKLICTVHTQCYRKVLRHRVALY